MVKEFDSKGQEFTEICLSGMSFSFPYISVASSGTSGICPVGPEIFKIIDKRIQVKIKLY